MKKNEIKNILIDSINGFEDIQKYKMIGTIGSINNSKEDFGDLDLVSISDLKTHKKFLKYLSDNFSKNKIKVRFFKTIVKKPDVSKDTLLVHDLHYMDLDYFLKKEWKTVINSILKTLSVLHGKDFFDNVPIQNISEKDIKINYLKWVNKINDIKRYKLFEEHLLKYACQDFYDYGFNIYGDRIKEIISSDANWKDKLRKIKEILIF
ncbi:MAG: hypothetical protein AABX54_04500 [Nanoarchaeota archaeon]